jgi:indolepyruvate decarboxylase
MATATIGGYLIRRLSEAGVRHVFGIPGDYVLGFYEQLDRSELELINCADEQGAGYAADAYARINGIGAVCVTYGVGGLKVVNTTAQAFAERSPVVVVSGGPGIGERERDALLHHKIRSFESQRLILGEVTCASAIIDDPGRAQLEIDRVIGACRRHSQPVYLELPRDLVDAPFELQPREEPSRRRDQAEIAEALAETTVLVAAAERPVILAGEELARFRLSGQLVALLERSRIPVATTTLSKSVIDETHPQYLGVYEGALGHETTRRYVEGSDCLLILGANLSDVTLGINTAHLYPAVTIRAHAAQTWVHRHLYPDVTLADFMEGLVGVVPVCENVVVENPPRPGRWTPVADAPVTIDRLFGCLNAFIDESTTVVADVGDALFAAIDLVVEAWEFIAPAYYLSLGFAIPGAIGVQLANPRTRPLVIVGDGAFQMTGMELTTAVRYGLDPIVILLDNAGYGTERPMLDGPFNDIVPWRYEQLPDILGAGHGFDVRTEGDLDVALTAARTERGAFSLLRVHLDPDDMSPALRRLTALIAERVRARSARAG